MGLSNYDGASGLIRDKTHSALAKLRGNGADESITVAQLDTMDLTPPHVIKIDVEGHESEVLDELFASKVGDLIREVVVECDGRFHAEGVAGIEQRLGACGFTLVAKSGSEEHFDAHWVRTA